MIKNFILCSPVFLLFFGTAEVNNLIDKTSAFNDDDKPILYFLKNKCKNSILAASLKRERKNIIFTYY